MKKSLVLVILIAFCGLFLCFTDSNIEKSKELNKENLYQAIKEMNIIHPDIVFAQIMLESSNLKSKLTKTNNNFFGMKQANKRETTSIGSLHGYAMYDNWYSCVVDYLLYQQNILKNKTVTKTQYLAIISKKYSECSTYKQRIKRVIKENKIFLRQQDSLYHTLACN